MAERAVGTSSSKVAQNYWFKPEIDPPFGDNGHAWETQKEVAPFDYKKHRWQQLDAVTSCIPGVSLVTNVAFIVLKLPARWCKPTKLDNRFFVFLRARDVSTSLKLAFIPGYGVYLLCKPSTGQKFPESTEAAGQGRVGSTPPAKEGDHQGEHTSGLANSLNVSEPSGDDPSSAAQLVVEGCSVALPVGGPLEPPVSHKVARENHPSYQNNKVFRGAVPDDKVPWAVQFDEYQPMEYTAEVVMKNNILLKPNDYEGKDYWADPADPNYPLCRFRRCGDRPMGNYPLVLDKKGCPVNPVGRTGITGRGLLGNWGPNHAADPMVTRVNPETGELELVIIKRKDTTKALALPGGMVDFGERIASTLRREFCEEAAAGEDAEAVQTRARLKEMFDKGGKEMYRGYVDDPRNTDNAWMETVATWFHYGDENLSLKAGDDASNVYCFPITDKELPSLYASHNQMVLDFAKQLISLSEFSGFSQQIQDQMSTFVRDRTQKLTGDKV